VLLHVQSHLCNLPHLAGLYKMVGAAGRLVALSARGAVADMLLWAIARVQTRVFASASYRKCVPFHIPVHCKVTVGCWRFQALSAVPHLLKSRAWDPDGAGRWMWWQQRLQRMRRQSRSTPWSCRGLRRPRR
jgi:hypothetical protein